MRTFYDFNPGLLPRHEVGDDKRPSLADPSCKHCHGTGSPGSIIITNRQPLKGKIDRMRKEGLLEVAPLVCKCVVRATNAESRDDVPWLRRADRNKQGTEETTSGSVSRSVVEQTDQEGFQL